MLQTDYMLVSQVFQEKHFPDAKLIVGGRPRKMTSRIERSVVINLTRGKIGNARDVAKQVRDVYGVDVSDVTVCRALHRAGLHSRLKEKKPHLSK
jgi:transposase